VREKKKVFDKEREFLDRKNGQIIIITGERE
jgi:hypothetical protein